MKRFPTIIKTKKSVDKEVWHAFKYAIIVEILIFQSQLFYFTIRYLREILLFLFILITFPVSIVSFFIIFPTFDEFVSIVLFFNELNDLFFLFSFCCKSIWQSSTSEKSFFNVPEPFLYFIFINLLCI